MTEKFRVEAHHAYAKTKADELDLAPGDIILVSSDEHASWWVGHKEGTNEQGWFPSNFVKRLEPRASASKPKSKPKLKREVRIIKQYDAVDEDDLSLRIGDIVEVKKEVDGWYLGRLNGNIGMFPVNYAEEYSAEAQAPPASRPLPVPPVPGASNAPPPIPNVPSPMSRRGTASGAAPGGALPGAPPTLPSRTPPLPPRASTDVSRLSEKALFGDDGGTDDAKKEKSKSGHRISRLFGSKKHKNKEGPSEGALELVSPRMDQPLSTTLDDEEPVDESSISPAIPNRPLPQPGSMSSPPPPPAGGRAMPPIPAMGVATLPPLPTAGIPQEQPAPRRPSVSSIGTASSVSVAPTQPLPMVQKSASNISTEHDDGTEQVSAAIAEGDEYTSQVTDEAGNGDAEEADTAESKARAGPKLAKIIEDYEAESPEELNLMQGDVVTIISQGTENEERWKGEYHGKKGYFPGQVVELIDENAEQGEQDEESGEAGASAKPKGFKLAAYGVQQGGIGSIFAAGGMPALRKSAPRKNSEAEAPAAAPAPTPAQPPAIPKLRSVQRPAPKEESPKEEQQPNFLAQLNRVPRKSMQSTA
ncbi:Intersectin 1 (SH3 domain protein), partial [Coemansia sp. RSA 1933]